MDKIKNIRAIEEMWEEQDRGEDMRPIESLRSYKPVQVIF